MGNISSLFTTEGVTDSERVLHTPGEFVRKNLLYVQEVGKLKSLQPHKSQRENLDSFLFFMVLSGEGTLTIGENEHKVRKGNCALISCMNYYAHESSRKNPWELMWVHFNGSVSPAYFNLFLEQNGQQNIFLPDSTKQFENIIEKLMEYQKQKDLEAELLSGDMLIRLLNESLLTVMKRSKESQETSLTECREIRETVNGHYQEEDLMEVLSDRYDMEEEILDSRFQKAYGITLRDYILNRRFTAAKELLRFTVKPVKEIIVESGIKNEDLFRRLFQDGEGMTAEEYRMKWAQWVK